MNPFKRQRNSPDQSEGSTKKKQRHYSSPKDPAKLKTQMLTNLIRNDIISDINYLCTTQIKYKGKRIKSLYALTLEKIYIYNRENTPLPTGIIKAIPSPFARTPPLELDPLEISCCRSEIKEKHKRTREKKIFC